MAPIFTQTMNIMKANGTQIIAVAGEECIMLMEISMKENGMTINVMDRGCLD